MTLFDEIEKSFPEIEKFFDQKSLKAFMNCSASGLSRYHFSLGLWIRNNLLAEGTHLLAVFNSLGITIKDDMSEVIIMYFYYCLKLKNNAGKSGATLCDRP